MEQVTIKINPLTLFVCMSVLDMEKGLIAKQARLELKKQAFLNLTENQFNEVAAEINTKEMLIEMGMANQSISIKDKITELSEEFKAEGQTLSKMIWHMQQMNKIANDAGIRVDVVFDK